MKKKVLLMGKSGSGKTSMRSIIFSNYLAKDTRRLGATIDIEHSHVRFLGNLVLNLWDCGGQETFMQNYFVSQRENIFKDVEVLVYVFDVDSRDIELKRDLEYYQVCLKATFQHSPNARVFCLVHKMDLIHESEKTRIFAERETVIIQNTKQVNCICLMSSIWDETLFKAWSIIIYKLIPNIHEMTKSLKTFGDIMECDEVMLFERTTFLIISSYDRVEHSDIKRQEKVSSIIKKFKFSCSLLSSQLLSIEVRNSKCSVFIDLLTPNTCIMVIMADPSTSRIAVMMNIKNAQKHFEVLEKAAYKETEDIRRRARGMRYGL